MSWRDFLKFSLEMASITFAFAPLTIALRTGIFADTVIAISVCLSLLAASLAIMRIVEKEMYEVLRRMRRGEMWYSLR